MVSRRESPPMRFPSLRASAGKTHQALPGAFARYSRRHSGSDFRHFRPETRRKINTGAQWHLLPQSYPNYKTVHRPFQTRYRDEVLRRVLTDVANELRDRGALDEEECFIDATFVTAKGGGLEIGA